MKIYIFILSALLMFFNLACDKDDQYTYEDGEVITISGIETVYDKIALIDTLVIDPQVVSSESGAAFDYVWAIYDTNPHASESVFDTIATTKRLDLQIDLAATSWALVFSATNKQTGLTKIFRSVLNVSTEFTRGWYVLKDESEQTDVDLFTTPESILPFSRSENVYSRVNGRKLGGQARGMALFSHFKTDLTGQLTNTRVLFFLAEQDASVVPIATLSQVQELNGMFFTPPDNTAPVIMTGNDMCIYLVNDGRVHNILAVAPNVGRFGAFQMMGTQNSPYRLAAQVMPHRFSNQIFFDEISSSFVMSPIMGTNLIMVNDHPASHMPARNNNKTCLYLGSRNFMAPVGYGVFHDKTDPSVRIISNIIAPSPASFQMINDTLGTTDKAYYGSLFTIFHMDENMMYFAVGNEVWSRNLSNRNEQLQFTAPAGTEITFLRHRYYMEDGYAFNYVMIGTHAGGNYKVHMFEKTAGNLNATPAFSLEGAGKVRDVMYVSPAVGNTTYPYFK